MRKARRGNAIFPPAMDRGNGRGHHLGYGASAAKAVDDHVGFGAHEASYAIIGSDTQVETSDNRDCDSRKLRLNSRMDPYEKLRPIAADILRRLDASGRKQRDLAAALGIEENKVSKVKSGDRQFQGDEVLKAHAWLDEIEQNIEPTERHVMAADPDEVEIQQWDVAYGMGGGTFLDLPVTGEKHKFSRSWLRQFTHAPANQVFLASGTGDSMTPTILDADIVVIDTSQREVRMADRIWAAAYGQTGIIKRLRPMPDGSVKILSDNPTVSPETAYDGELSIVGRVVAIVRKT